MELNHIAKLMKRIFNKLICLIVGHKVSANSKNLSLLVTGLSEIPIAHIRLCTRCHSVHWVYSDNVPKKYYKNVEEYDIMKYQQKVLEEITKRSTIGNA